MMQALAPSSQLQYSKHWQSFKKITNSTLKTIALPASSYDVGLYIVYLHSMGLKANSIRSYLSAISFVHKLNDHLDPIDKFRIKKLLDVLKNMDGPKKKRAAITISLLQKIVDAIDFVAPNKFDKKLFKSAFLLMYHVCLRISEIAVSKQSSHTLHLNNFISRKDELQICMNSFKHSHNRSYNIKIKATKDKYSPLVAYNNYKILGGSFPGPFYLKKNGKPLRRTQIAAVLGKALASLSMKEKNYNTHSFRIGKITDLAALGASDNQLRQTGRFHSNTFMKYIKPNTVLIPSTK